MGKKEKNFEVKDFNSVLPHIKSLTLGRLPNLSNLQFLNAELELYQIMLKVIKMIRYMIM